MSVIWLGALPARRSIGRRIPGGNIFASATGVDEHFFLGYGPAGCVARSIRIRARPGARFMARLRGSRPITTGAVITEAFYFLSNVRNGPPSLSSFLDASATEVRDVFNAEALAAAVRLMSKYAEVPMDFPDATLVWIAELSAAERILTLDRRGFSSFRFGNNRRFKLALDL